MQHSPETLITRVSAHAEFVAEPRFFIALSLAVSLWRDQEGCEEAEEVLGLLCGYKRLRELRKLCGPELESLAALPGELEMLFGGDMRQPVGSDAVGERVGHLFQKSEALSTLKAAVFTTLRGTMQQPRVAEACMRPKTQLATVLSLYMTDDLKLCTACLGEIMRTDERRLALVQTEMRDLRALEAQDLLHMIEILASV